MEFNKNLKEIRKSKGLTQKDICEKLQVSNNCYASWEQGRTQPDINSIRKLCAIFDVSADYLLGLENEEGISLRENFLPSDIIPNKNQK
ncbi:MAG: helix-turn-helix transcriptional regulator [Clostridiales bacterium]|nr:helix-turn-helix transcriptional regulator [Clostridiales bacterium]